MPIFCRNISPSLPHCIEFANFLLLFGYNFVMNGPIWIISGMKVGIDNKNRTSFKFLQNDVF